MSAHVTVPIELPEEEAALLQEWARQQGMSVSDLVRRLLHQERQTAATPLTDEEYDTDPLWSIAGMAETGTADGSVNHDRYLYPTDAPAPK
jgi:hypothetical protein